MTTIFSILFSQIAFVLLELSKSSENSLEIDHYQASPRKCHTCTLAYTDFWQAYQTVIPLKSHRAVGKESGQTNHIELLNNTFRQRLSRLVRSSLSFSKKLDNHIGAIWYFIHSYSSELASV